MGEIIMKLQIQSVIYGNQVDALVKAMKALQQAVKVYHRRVGDLQVRLIYGDSTPTPVLDEKTQKDIREMLKAEIEFEYKVFGFNSGTAKGHNLMAENTDADIMMIMNPDVILEPTCLCKLMEPLKLKEVGMVEARQTPLEHAKEYNTKTGETEWASTACTVFKTEVYNKINGFDEKVEQLKNEQLKAKSDIENTVKELQSIEILKQKTQNIEEEFNQLEVLKAKIELANKEIEMLRQFQKEQINNVNYKISELKKLQLDNNKELIERIESINYDEKLVEINENITRNKNEYTKMIEEINNKNKQEEKPSNIISFESLKKKRKANKKVFSINENIMSDELENASSYVIELNNETFGIMAN